MCILCSLKIFVWNSMKLLHNKFMNLHKAIHAHRLYLKTQINVRMIKAWSCAKFLPFLVYGFTVMLLSCKTVLSCKQFQMFDFIVCVLQQAWVKSWNYLTVPCSPKFLSTFVLFFFFIGGIFWAHFCMQRYKTEDLPHFNGSLLFRK